MSFPLKHYRLTTGNGHLSWAKMVLGKVIYSKRLLTDESVDVQNAKTEYEFLKSKGENLSSKDAQRMSDVQQNLSRLMPQRDLGIITSKEVACTIRNFTPSRATGFN